MPQRKALIYLAAKIVPKAGKGSFKAQQTRFAIPSGKLQKPLPKPHEAVAFGGKNKSSPHPRKIITGKEKIITGIIYFFTEIILFFPGIFFPPCFSTKTAFRFGLAILVQR